MSNIKLVDGWGTMPLSDVIKAVEGGEPWAFRIGTRWEAGDLYDCEALCRKFVLAGPSAVAIIDDTQPVIDWDEFDWDFFNPFGGVSVVDDIGIKWHKQTAGKTDRCELCPSPFYYWPGGECPVPGNVEVEIDYILRDTDQEGDNSLRRCRNTLIARCVDWENEFLVGFRLTGKVYPPKHKE